jgi:caspase 7
MDHTDNECFVIVIMTHGSSKSVLYANDKEYYVNDLLTYLNNKNCASLVGKPKFVFVQSCRGNSCDDGVKVQYIRDTTIRDGVDSEVNQPVEITIPTMADMLIMYSTFEGVTEHF